MKKKAFHSSLLSLLILILCYAFEISGVFQRFENRLWDIQVKYLSDPSEHDPSIKLILIDQSSLDWAQNNLGLSWPWPREVYSAMIAHAQSGGAKAVIFDMIFSEPSFYGQEDDQRFALSLQQTRSIGSLVLSNTQGESLSWPSSLLKPLYQTRTDEDVKEYTRSTFPTASLASSFSALGSVVSSPDEDGIIRKTDLIQSFSSHMVPSLALSTYLSTNAEASYRLQNHQLILNNRPIPLTDDNKAIINYHGPSQTYKTFNAVSIIESSLSKEEGKASSIPPQIFKNSYVIIGVSAPGLMDLKSTPTQNVYPGPEIHATILDNLIHNDFISELPSNTTYFLLSVMIFISLMGIRSHTTLHIGVLYPLSTIIISILGSVIAYYFQIWFPLGMFVFAIFLTAIIGFGINYFYEGAQKRFIKNAFSRYISPQLIDSLIKHPENLKLGGRRETLSILFSDIEGFTTISTKMEPETLARFLNEYLGLMSDVIMDMGGTIDKYEGDAIIAFWNAPLPQQDHPLLAVKAAMKSQELLREHNPYFLKHYGHEIKTRFGIHTGDVIIGNLGTEKRFDYTFIGDAGNLASRLESANKQFSTYVMISDQTRKLLGDLYTCRELGNIRVVGRSESVRVFEPLNSTKNEWLQEYNHALNLFYEGNLDEAYRLFSEMASSDPVCKAYVHIIDKIRAGTMKYHDGTIDLDEK